MRLIVTLILVGLAMTLAAEASGREPRRDLLRDNHAKRCPTEAPCNYCAIEWPAEGFWLQTCGPVNDEWGAECRCKSGSGWQNGKVMTVYPDKPFDVNY